VRAAYVTTYDSSDVRSWSGLGYHISRCLELAGLTLERIGPLERRVSVAARFRQIEGRLQRRGYPLDRDPDVVEQYSAEVARRLRSVTCDLVFSPGTIPVADLDTDHPLALWTGATFGAMVGFYPDYRSLSKRAVRAGMELDTRALERASVAFYTSEWAARSAVELHGADVAKVEVVPYGANMPVAYTGEQIARVVAKRPQGECRLLFVGVDWRRKRGDRVVEIARVLNERGLPTQVDAVGSAPDDASALPSWVRLHGFVDKSTEDGVARLRDLFERAHFLVHPAEAEAFGVVFCEAAGHGVVALASRVGGIPSAVRDGVSGLLFDVDAPAEDYAERIWELAGDRSRYEALALGAFDEYRRNLNWEVQAERIHARLEKVWTGR
jgi:glycosyltransferase involved in cell wall biosynthesis